MKILKKGGVVEKRGEEETKSMPHAPVKQATYRMIAYNQSNVYDCNIYLEI